MKKILLIIAILSVAFHFSFAQSPTPTPGENQKSVFFSEPSLQLFETLKLAKKYITKNKIDISRHYLDNIRLLQQSPWMEGKHWILTWKIKNNFVDGGEILIIIGMDKTIKMTYGE